jgi:hypothetical protein
MSQTRREFWLTVGATAAIPALWQRAEAEVQQTGEVSVETVRALLQFQGAPGIYTNPDRMAELRAAVTRTIRSHQRLRGVPVPDDVPPAMIFRRG